MKKICIVGASGKLGKYMVHRAAGADGVISDSAPD